MARHCRNWEIEDRIGEERRLEYENKNNRQRRMIEEGDRQNNLNSDRDLIVLD